MLKSPWSHHTPYSAATEICFSIHQIAFSLPFPISRLALPQLKNEENKLSRCQYLSFSLSLVLFAPRHAPGSHALSTNRHRVHRRPRDLLYPTLAAIMSGSRLWGKHLQLYLSWRRGRGHGHACIFVHFLPLPASCFMFHSTFSHSLTLVAL